MHRCVPVRGIEVDVCMPMVGYGKLPPFFIVSWPHEGRRRHVSGTFSPRISRNTRKMPLYDEKGGLMSVAHTAALRATSMQVTTPKLHANLHLVPISAAYCFCPIVLLYSSYHTAGRDGIHTCCQR